MRSAVTQMEMGYESNNLRNSIGILLVLGEIGRLVSWGLAILIGTVRLSLYPVYRRINDLNLEKEKRKK